MRVRSSCAAGIAALLILCGAAWKPGALQTAIVDRLLAKLNASTPYQIRIEGASGDFIGHIALNGVHVSARGDSTELLQARVLDLSIKWSNLLHRRLELRSLKLSAPTLFLTLDADGRLAWPQGSQAPADDSEFAFSIQRIEITQGKIIVRNRAADPEKELTLSALEASAGLTSERFDIQKMSLALNGGTLSARGHVDRKEPRGAALDLQTRDFPVHDALRAVVALPAPLRLMYSGGWTITGDGKTWKVRTQGSLGGAPLAVALRTVKDGYAAQVKLNPLPLRTIWRDPEVGRLGVLSASFTASSPQWASRAVDVSGAWRIVQPSSGPFQAPVSRAQVQLARGRGTMTVQFSAQGLEAGATAALNLPESRLDGRFNVDLKNVQGLSEWLPALKNAEGSLTAEGTVKGPFQALAAEVTARGAQWRMQRTRIEETRITLQGKLGHAQTLTVEGSAKKIALDDAQESPWDVQSADIHLAGQPDAWKAKMELAFRNELSFHYTGAIQKQRAGWRFMWDALTLAPKKGPDLHSTQAGEAVVEDNGALVLRRLGLSTGQGTLEMPEARFGKDGHDLQVSIKDVPLASLASLVAPDKKYEGLLNAEIQFHGALRAPTGFFQIRISTGVVQNWAYRELVFAGRAEPPWITVDQLTVQLTHAEHNINGHGRIPLHLLDARQPDEAMTLHLDAPNLDLDLLRALLPGVVIDKGGDAALVADITGRPADPDVKGHLSAHFPHLRIAKEGLDIRDFAADIDSEGKTVRIAAFQGKTKKGEFHMTGTSELPKLNFVLAANDLTLDIPKQLKARMNLTLAITGDLEGPDIAGDIALKEGTYTQPKKSKKEKALEDAKKNAPPEPPSALWEGTTLDVHAHWPHSVWYRDGLTKIETAGDVRIQKDEDELTPYMTGQINIVRGSYDAYGRDFQLNSGVILFTGPPDLNPTLNIEASYMGGGTLVYLDVKGTANEPQLILRSNPPLAQEDIVSVLIFGHPLNQINAGGVSDQSQSAQAEAAAGSALGSYFSKGLRESGMDLGLDVVRVDATNTGGNRLTVGRYIGSKLFVSYGEPIQGNTVRVFDASYYLMPNLALVGETGYSTDSYVDLLCIYPLNKSASGSPGFVPTSNQFLTPTQALPFPQANPAH